MLTLLQLSTKPTSDFIRGTYTCILIERYIATSSKLTILIIHRTRNWPPVWTWLLQYSQLLFFWPMSKLWGIGQFHTVCLLGDKTCKSCCCRTFQMGMDIHYYHKLCALLVFLFLLPSLQSHIFLVQWLHFALPCQLCPMICQQQLLPYPLPRWRTSRPLQLPHLLSHKQRIDQTTKINCRAHSVSEDTSYNSWQSWPSIRHSGTQGPHRGGCKRDSLQEKKKPEATSQSVRAAGRFGPKSPTICTNSSYVTAFVFR